jgi:hypothetical protein
VRQAVIVGVASAGQVRSVKRRALALRLLHQPLGKLAPEWIVSRNAALLQRLLDQVG